MNRNRHELTSVEPCADRSFGKLKFAAIVCAVLLLGMAIFSMCSLGELQRDRYRYASDTLVVNDGIVICDELGRLVSAGEFGRDPEKIEKDWGAAKQKLLGAVGNLRATAEADEKQRMAVADQVLHTFIVLFERRRAMRTGNTESRREHDALKVWLELQTATLSGLLSDHGAALHKKAREADEAYESISVSIIWLTAGSLSLVTLLIFLGGRESGEIRRLQRLGSAGTGEK